MDNDAAEPVEATGHPFVVFDHQIALDRIRAAVAARSPFSLIRLGDGEAVLLSVDESAWLSDLAELHRHWGAERVTLGDVLGVRRDLEAALANADLLGLRPDVLGVTVPDDLLDRPLAEIGECVRERFNLRNAEKAVGDNVARRLALAHEVMTRLPESSAQELCSSWIHWEMLAGGLIAELLESASEVVLVTSHPELGPVVAEKYDVRTRLVTVPGKFVDTGKPAAHVPDRYAELRSELTGFPPGTLALVGAGIPGKIYCHWLKEAGCVALDVGSVLDAWIGKPSRKVMLQERFGVEDRSVPADLRLVDPGPSPRTERREASGAGDGPGQADSQRREAGRLRTVEARLQRAQGKRMQAQRERDDARRELAALHSRRSVRAALALTRLLRRGRD